MTEKSKGTRVLIVDDDPTFNLMLKTFLNKNDFLTEEVHSGKSGIRAINETNFDVVLTDLRLPDVTGLDLLEKARAVSPDTPVILMTSYADIKSAVKAMQMGAFDYITKPINPDELLITIKDALGNKPSLAQGSDETKTDYVQGSAERSKKIEEYIELVAPTDMSVIIEGESGTGKEYASRKIHTKSQRKDGPFVAIDCGALPKELTGSELFGHKKGAFTGAIKDKKGQFELANGGTLFLDEIGNLTYDIQIQLLRAIQERKVRSLGSDKDIDVDVRIICATNENLKSAVENGDFREDLFHRLNEFKIDLPALRDRPEDIVIYADHFLKKSNVELNKSIVSFDKSVLQAFQDYSWPGNLRELKNVIKRAVLLTKGGQISVDCLPSEITDPPKLEMVNQVFEETASSNEITGLKAVTGQKEKEIIQKALEQVRYNKSKAAKILNIDRKTLYNKIKQYDLDA